MSAPRCVLPATTYLITRRCSERRFFLRPSPRVNRVLLYCLALTTRRFGILVHAFCFLSNHYHLVVTDVRGELPRFMHNFNLLVARALNCLRGRFEALWASGTYSAVRLPDREAILDKIAYTLANPVEAGLVHQGAHWPGLRSQPHHIGVSRLRAMRPACFFRGPKESTVDAELVLELAPPPGFEDLSLEELQACIAERVERREAEARARHEREGRPVAGRRTIRKQSPFDRPRTYEPRFGLNPRVAGRDKWKRKEALEQLRAFLAAYREAWARFKAGLRDVVFPAGTWLLRILHGVPCEAPS